MPVSAASTAATALPFPFGTAPLASPPAVDFGALVSLGENIDLSDKITSESENNLSAFETAFPDISDAMAPAAAPAAAVEAAPSLPETPAADGAPIPVQLASPEQVSVPTPPSGSTGPTVDHAMHHGVHTAPQDEVAADHEAAAEVPVEPAAAPAPASKPAPAVAQQPATLPAAPAREAMQLAQADKPMESKDAVDARPVARKVRSATEPTDPAPRPAAANDVPPPPAPMPILATPAPQPRMAAAGEANPQDALPSDTLAPAAPRRGEAHTALEMASDEAAQPGAGSDAALSVQNDGQDNLPSLLVGQTPAVHAGRSPVAGHRYPAPAPAAAAEQPVVAAQTGRIGRDMGVEIARQVSAGREEMLVRLDPAEMGRIDVRLSFDEKGSLHARMSADSSAALDMLRRDAGDLGRALADAGVRADVSNFRFDTRGGDAGSGQFGQDGQSHGQRGGDGRGQHGGQSGRDQAQDHPSYRQLRTSGRVDLTA